MNMTRGRLSRERLLTYSCHAIPRHYFFRVKSNFHHFYNFYKTVDQRMSASMYEVFHWAGDSKPLKFSIAGPEINIGEPSASSSSAKRATRCHSMVLGEERV